MAVSKYEYIPIPGSVALAQMNLVSGYSPEARLFSLEERVKLLEDKMQKLMEERYGNR